MQEHDKANLTQTFKVNGHEERKVQVISNSFCPCFSNVGFNNAKQIGPSSFASEKYRKNKIFKNIFTGPTDPNQSNN